MKLMIEWFPSCDQSYCVRWKQMALDSIDSKLKFSGSSNPIFPTTGFRISLEDLNDPSLSYPIRDLTTSKQSYRGICLIINQRDFDRSTNQSRRDGTDVDADRVEKLFKSLHYTVQRYLNVNRADFSRILQEMSGTDHRQFDSFVCVILSHGEQGTIFARDGPVPVDYIISHFRGDRSPTLVGKPKLFFIQACRGSDFDTGAAFATDAAEGVMVVKLPVEADILVAYSTVPGYFAWRNSTTGSWFIQEICKVLEADRDGNRPHDLISLLTVVARCVAYQYRSCTHQPLSHNMVQMTSHSSTLTRLVHLTGDPKT